MCLLLECVKGFMDFVQYKNSELIQNEKVKWCRIEGDKVD